MAASDLPPITLLSRVGRLCLLLTLLACARAGASDSLVLKVGDIAAAGWRAGGVRATLDLHSSAVLLQIDRLELPSPVGTLRAIEIHCEESRLSGPEFSCEGGRIRLQHSALASRPFRGDFYYQRASGLLRFTLDGIPLAGGALDIKGEGSSDSWRLRGVGESLDLVRLQTLAGLATPALTIAGTLATDFDLRLKASQVAGSIKLRLRQLQLSDDSGRLATDGLDIDLGAELRPDSQGLAFVASANSRLGQLYMEPVFVDAGMHPFTVTAQGRWGAGVLDLAEIRIDQPSAISALGHLQYSGQDGLREAGVLIERARLPALYELYLQPFLIGTALDDLTTSGELTGELAWADAAPARVDLRLSEVDLEDRSGRFALRGLAGRIDWSPRPAAGGDRDSRLVWHSGHVRGIALGAANLPLRLAGRDLVLLEPVRIPVLDGALIINTLQALSVGLPELKLAFDGRLAPIDMRRFSAAIGWPVFSGTLAGRLPSLSYEDGELTLNGQLEIEAFGGRAAVEGLRLRDPFGAVPRLAADIHLRDLDLKTMTETFSFGRIEGRLHGDIEHLRLVNWQPAAFQARFYTPEDDRSRHRISQRAIENISSLGGGGAAAVLSRGFLRFFEDFSYDRIGISCRLQEDVCLMGGLAPAHNGLGYYLVRGRWLPRVDVIGFQRQVSWPTLVEQLKSVTASEGPIIK